MTWFYGVFGLIGFSFTCSQPGAGPGPGPGEDDENEGCADLR